MLRLTQVELNDMTDARDILKRLEEADLDADDMALLQRRGNPEKVRTDFLDGRRVCYTSDTIFLVQIAGNEYGEEWKTRNRVLGNFGQAFMCYKGINIGRGYKKRLMAPSMEPPLLAEQGS